MADFLDMLRDFTKFTGKIEHDMRKAAKGLQLPDEIDLYNFFEEWKGRAECRFYEGMITISSFTEYASFYDDAISIRYHIGKSRYYALRFVGKGVFLVSEKRYNELKEKKGK